MIEEDLLREYLRKIKPVNHIAKRRVMLKEAKSLKITNSLGNLDVVARQVLSIKEEIETSNFKKAIVVMAGDHGVAEESVSVFKSSTTGKVLKMIGEGKAPINAIADTSNAILMAVDMGIIEEIDSCSEIINMKLGDGTKNISNGPAMSREQAISGIIKGIQLVSLKPLIDMDIIAVGEIGIANTTSSSAITSLLCKKDPREVVGKGTGVNIETQNRKIEVIKRSIYLNQPNPNDPLDVLSKLGGFEIAGVVGVILGAAINKIPVVIDGYISSVAALLACKLSNDVLDYIILSHLSAEPGHKYLAVELEKFSLLDLGMCLGQSSGAGLCLSLIESACAVHLKTATIYEANLIADDKNKVK
ncbi:nicotinate-nucleotide--dimethylbenzimidazole phosphoribosyltransferase [Bacillus cereus]